MTSGRFGVRIFGKAIYHGTSLSSRQWVFNSLACVSLWVQYCFIYISEVTHVKVFSLIKIRSDHYTTSPSSSELPLINLRGDAASGIFILWVDIYRLKPCVCTLYTHCVLCYRIWCRKNFQNPKRGANKRL